MKIQKIELNKIKTTLNNVKHHNRKNIDSIKKSLKNFQQYTPLVLSKKSKEILKGKGTFIAMKQLNYTEADIIFVNVTPQEEKQLIVLDNRSSQLSKIDQEIVEKMFYELNDDEVDLTAYSEKEVQRIMNVLTIQDLEDQTEKINSYSITCPYCKAEFITEQDK